MLGEVMTDAEYVAMVKRESDLTIRLVALQFGRQLAEDATADAMLIVWRRRRDVRVETAGSYLRVIAHRQALKLLKPRESDDDGTLLDLVPGSDHEPVDDAVSRERADEVARALLWLKPDEATALLLKAAGWTYKEIARRQGWTYTKVNRCVTEGRRALFERLRDRGVDTPLDDRELVAA